MPTGVFKTGHGLVPAWFLLRVRLYTLRRLHFKKFASSSMVRTSEKTAGASAGATLGLDCTDGIHMPSSEAHALTCGPHATVLTLLQTSPKVKPLALFGRVLTQCCYGDLHFPASRKAAPPRAVTASKRSEIAATFGPPIPSGGPDQSQEYPRLYSGRVCILILHGTQTQQ